MSRAPGRAMVNLNLLMKLAKTLVKFLAVSALAAGALGGAAALGSTIFQPPPRDKAEFEARVEAGSTFWADLEDAKVTRDRARRKLTRGWKGRPREEAKYLRALDGVCTRERNALDRLPAPRGRRQTLAYLTSWLRVTRAHQKQVRALDGPRPLERRMEQYLGLWEDSERNVVQLRRAVRQKESFYVLLVMDELDGLGAQARALAGKLGFTSCVVDDFPEV